MIPVEPTIPEGSRLVVFAKDQPQYVPLMAAVDDEGTTLTEWAPTAHELWLLLRGGRVRLSIMTFGQPLQPVCLDVLAPDCGVAEKES